MNEIVKDVIKGVASYLMGSLEFEISVRIEVLYFFKNSACLPWTILSQIFHSR